MTPEQLGTLIQLLHVEIASVCPIDGVSVPDWSDKTTWKIDYTAAATDAQKQSAQAVVSAFDPNAPVVPQIISDRQFFQQLAFQSVITQDDALAAVKTGTLPPALVQLVAVLPSDQQFGANMLLSGATVFDRKHPMVAILGQAFGWNDAQLDALWMAAFAL